MPVEKLQGQPIPEGVPPGKFIIQSQPGETFAGMGIKPDIFHLAAPARESLQTIQDSKLSYTYPK